ncbi:hypothetical protein GJW-30_1_02047 [Variibacter gotjawalensis]|uniref:Transposase n=1 Tax=Variibacter gotjawalensis TaxID=1333996 RepID=A0A0S3PU93_9BRAD|nr:hypothetical protein [Variibacter gotjawalensis]NIK49839.1 hypothetical protein [Variibacter gotjawalensis]RZS45838.1 hypothetical protein EV661_4164 [Variibacter gotjawalensis]BAT59514.1 hypothetical protein GJW-30_1_02047 [Variibacter gotjawalensis]
MTEFPPEAPKHHEMPQIVMRGLPGGLLQLEIKGVVPVEVGTRLMQILSDYRDSELNPTS